MRLSSSLMLVRVRKPSVRALVFGCNTDNYSELRPLLILYQIAYNCALESLLTTVLDFLNRLEAHPTS